MTIQEAVQKAVDAGYRKGYLFGVEEGRHVFTEENGQLQIKRVVGSQSVSDILLDPSFWSSLGTAIGWGYEDWYGIERSAWVVRWHSFIDALAEGKSIEDFFSTLTN